MEIFPFTICGGQFLGNDVVVAGTDVTKKQPTCQVKIVDFSSGQQHQFENADAAMSLGGGGVGGKGKHQQRHMVRGEASIRGRCSAMELCGVPSISKNYVAVAVNDANKGFVSLLEVQPSPQGQGQGLYHVAPVQSFEQKPDEGSNFNSLAYFAHQSHLAAATETGDVVITDLASATDITRRRVDSAGALVVRYTPAGLVVSLGQSNAGQVLLWDPRTAPPVGSSIGGGGGGGGGGDVFSFQRPLVNSSRGLGVVDRDAYLTCLETHPSNEYELYCGTSTGSIVMWDIRKNDTSDTGSVVEMERCQHSSGEEVTALAFMGAGRSPPVLSGAVDGSVACVNYHERLHHTSSVFRQSDMLGGGGGGSGELDIGFDQGTSAITSLQTHPHTGQILVTSKLGEVNLL